MFEKWSLNPLAVNVGSQVILRLMQKADAALPDLPLPRRLLMHCQVFFTLLCEFLNLCKIFSSLRLSDGNIGF